MAATETLLLASSAFAGAIAAYPVLANQNSWPRGNLFTNGVSTLIYLGTMAFGLALIGTMAIQDKTSWMQLVWFVLASFAGGPFVTLFFGRHSGWIAIFGAPVLMLSAVITWQA